MADGSAHGVWLRARATPLSERLLHATGPRLGRLARGRLPWVTYRAFARPRPRSAEWITLRPRLSGICGSDLALLTGKTSSILSPFASLPAVLGHEVVAEISGGPRAGERVVLDPLISCVMRGLPPCRWCEAGLPSLCLNAAEGELSPGLMTGFCADLPGGWSDAMVAHVSQLHAVPDVLADEEAVLAEPFAVAMHAVLRRPPADGERVLVVGGGTLGLLTVAALRLTSPAAEITVAARHPLQARLARELGAARTIGGRRDALVRAAAEVVGARPYRSLRGETVLAGGFAHVIDAVGSAESLASCMRAAAPRGTLVVLGGVGRVRDLDWTLVWARELELVGTYVYGREPTLAGAPHTFDHVLGLMAEHRELNLGRLVTHRFGLREWPAALGAALDRGGSGAIKITLHPDDLGGR